MSHAIDVVRNVAGREEWSPGLRALVGAAGGGLLAYGMTQRFPMSCVLGTLGLALLGWSMTELSPGRVLDMTGVTHADAGTERSARPAGTDPADIPEPEWPSITPAL